MHSEYRQHASSHDWEVSKAHVPSFLPDLLRDCHIARSAAQKQILSRYIAQLRIAVLDVPSWRSPLPYSARQVQVVAYMAHFEQYTDGARVKFGWARLLEQLVHESGLFFAW